MGQRSDDCAIDPNLIILCPLFKQEYVLDFFLPLCAVCSLICGVYSELFLRTILTVRRKFCRVRDINQEATPAILRIEKKK